MPAMTSTETDDYKRDEMAFGMALSEIERLRHNFKITRRAKEERDLKFELEKKAHLEDIAEQKERIERAFSRSPQLAEGYRERFAHLLDADE